MANQPATLDKLENFVENLRSQIKFAKDGEIILKQKDVTELLTFFSKIAQNLKKLSQETIVSLEKTTTKQLKRVGDDIPNQKNASLQAIKQFANELQAVINESARSTVSTSSEKEAQRLRKIASELIPEFSSLYSKIEELERNIPVLDSAEEVRDKLETLKGEERLDVSAIKGLEERLKKTESTKAQFIGGGIIGRDFIKDIDISSMLDGVASTFNIPAVWNIVSVNLSSYPYGSLRKGIDYTFTPTSITFTSEIDPETQLSAGQKCILVVVTA